MTGVLGLYQPSLDQLLCFAASTMWSRNPLQAEIYILPTVKNGQLINRYQNYVDLLYYEREISNTVASFIVREEITSS